MSLGRCRADVLLLVLQFLNQLMLKLREIYLMPGETLIRAGDMSRELAFVARVTSLPQICSFLLRNKSSRDA